MPCSLKISSCVKAEMLCMRERGNRKDLAICGTVVIKKEGYVVDSHTAYLI